VALNAEGALDDATGHAKRTDELEKELKEKINLIGKNRYESVVLNEHLTEALRRLRKNTSETNVDRRLVTNVLLQSLTTPRSDSKRFEMHALLASILGWSDTERERAGLQRSIGAASPGSRAGKAPELERADETESFSKMWVEFLLKEAAQGSGAGVGTPPVPSSPTGTESPSRAGLPAPGARSPPAATPFARRLPSFTSSGSISRMPLLDRRTSEPPSR